MNTKNLSLTLLTAGLMTACGGPLNETEEVLDEGSNATVESEVQAWQQSRTYRVTVQNVTAGNGVSPPLVIAHLNSYRLFQVGVPATPGIAALAETGATDALQNELSQQRNVRAVAKAEGGPIPAGQKRVIEITLPRGSRSADLKLNVVAMIGRSNDSFVSTSNGIDLSRCDNGAISVELSNFDSGSEENTGNVADFGSGGHPVAQAEGLVSYDRGLNPRGDAPNLAAWGSTAAVVTVERIR
jgi:hypothetical protein